MSEPIVRVCAISGGSGAGKSTLAVKLLERLGPDGNHLTIDWYYRDLSHLSADERAAVNFDHPDSLEVDLFVSDLRRIRQGEVVEAPVYDFASHTRTVKTVTVEPRPIIVAEGIHLLGLAPVRSECALLVFIDVSAEIRLERRIARDVVERGRTHESVIDQWSTTVAPMHERYVQPSKQHADVVVTNDDDLDDVADRLATRLTLRAEPS